MSDVVFGETSDELITPSVSIRICISNNQLTMLCCVFFGSEY